MDNVSAADMFASEGCELACSNFQKNPEIKNTTARLLAGAFTVGSVILATQLRAQAQDGDIQEGEFEYSNLSNEILQQNVLPLPANFDVEEVLGSVSFNESQEVDVANLNFGQASTNISNGMNGSAISFPSENGIPDGAISISPGVDDPAQATGEISSQTLGSKTFPINEASFGIAALKGEDGVNGRDGIDGTNGEDGINGINGIDGENGLNGSDGADGQDGANGADGADGADGINGTNGTDGSNGSDGVDGLATFVIDPITLQNPNITATLGGMGFEIETGPAGFGYIIATPDQILELSNLFSQSAIVEEAESEEGAFPHGEAVIAGNDTDDYLEGDGENNVLNGYGGNDILVGSSGADIMFGGEDNDTADYSGSEFGVNIDIKDHVFSGGDAEGDSLVGIENIVGSEEIDTIIGDKEINLLFGNAGDDILFGNAGDDKIQGGIGADHIDGGEGTGDVSDYTTSQEGVNISLLDDTASGGDAEGDELDNIEFLNGSKTHDFLQGDGLENRIGGLSGDDELYGEGGNDTLLGGFGADIINGGDGTDTSDYTASAEGVIVNLSTGESRLGEAEGDQLTSIEYLAGSAFDDILTGDEGINRLTGRDGDDQLFGEGGNDRLVGGLGADHLDGGEGNRDTADYSAALEAVGVDLVEGGFEGEADGDTYNSIEFVVGSSDHDIIFGDAGVNRITGGTGCDIISGRDGNDSLFGGQGGDVLNGGEGDDVFIYASNDGYDIIEDFEAGVGRTDRVDFRLLDDALFGDFSDIQAAMTDTDDGALLNLGEESAILFQNVATADLVADDFILA